MLKRKQQLEQFYRDTTYSIFIEGIQYDIKVGKKLPPVIQELVRQEKSAVILTAWNPGSQALPMSENKSRNKELHSKFKDHTLYNTLGQGSDSSWSAEESFFILGLSREEAEQLALDFEQYAYVWLEAEKPASLVFSVVWDE
jgi:hypothetical protein